MSQPEELPATVAELDALIRINRQAGDRLWNAAQRLHRQIDQNQARSYALHEARRKARARERAVERKAA